MDGATDDGRSQWEAMVPVGRIARAHGNVGRVIIDPDTDFVEERFKPGEGLHVWNGAGLQRLVIEDVRFQRHRPIVAFAGIETMTEAEALASVELRIPTQTLGALPANTFYYHELVGCRVETAGGLVVGTVNAVEGETSAHRLIVSDGGTEVQVPLVDEICVDVDPAEGVVKIDPPEGLLELNPARHDSSRRHRKR